MAVGVAVSEGQERGRGVGEAVTTVAVISSVAVGTTVSVTVALIDSVTVGMMANVVLCIVAVLVVGAGVVKGAIVVAGAVEGEGVGTAGIEKWEGLAAMKWAGLTGDVEL